MNTRNYYPNIHNIIKKNISFVNIAKSKTYYKELAPVYELISARKNHTKMEVDFLKRLFSKCVSNKILDLACGVGRHSRELAKAGFDTYAIDQSEEMLKHIAFHINKISGFLGDYLDKLDHKDMENAKNILE